jgi:hypothetical protein
VGFPSPPRFRRQIGANLEQSLTQRTRRARGILICGNKWAVLRCFWHFVCSDHLCQKAFLAGLCADPQHPDWPLWCATAISADGSRIIVASSQVVYYSTNFGATWMTNSLSKGMSVCCSADGTKLAAAGWDGLAYVSTDSGGSWLALTNLNSYSVARVTCTASGDRLLAAAKDGPIFISANWGLAWQQMDAPNLNWRCLTCSADGGLMAGVQWTNVAPGVGLVHMAKRCPAPWLDIAASPAGPMLAWTVPSTPFALQESSHPGTSNWISVPVTTQLNYTNLKYQVTLPAPSEASFYRLRSE